MLTPDSSGCRPHQEVLEWPVSGSGTVWSACYSSEQVEWSIMEDSQARNDDGGSYQADGHITGDAYYLSGIGRVQSVGASALAAKTVYLVPLCFVNGLKGDGFIFLL